MKNDPKFSERLADIPDLFGIPLFEVAKMTKSVHPQTVRRIAEGKGKHWNEDTFMQLKAAVDHIYKTKKKGTLIVTKAPLPHQRPGGDPRVAHVQDDEPTVVHSNCTGSFLSGMAIMALIFAGIMWWKGTPMFTDQTLVIMKPAERCITEEAPVDTPVFEPLPEIDDCDGPLSVGGSYDCDDYYDAPEADLI